MHDSIHRRGFEFPAARMDARSEAPPDAKAPAAVHRGNPHGSKSDAQAAMPVLPAIQAITRERLLVPADFR